MFNGRFLKLCAIFVFCWAVSYAVPAFADDELAASMEVGTWTTNPRYISFGNYNGHDLRWRVLEVYSDKTALLVLDDVLRDSSNVVVRLEFNNLTYDNNFPGSSMNKWLNDDDNDTDDGMNGFIFSAGFNDYQVGILDTEYGPDTPFPIDNAEDSKYKWEGDTQTCKSKIFLLSVGEVTKPEYFSDGEKMNTYYFDSNADRDVGDNYWLRSPGPVADFVEVAFSGGQVSDLGSNAAVVFSGGQIDDYGDRVDSQYAVRPALKIDLTSPVFTSTSLLVSYS